MDSYGPKVSLGGQLDAHATLLVLSFGGSNYILLFMNNQSAHFVACVDLSADLSPRWAHMQTCV